MIFYHPKNKIFEVWNIILQLNLSSEYLYLLLIYITIREKMKATYLLIIISLFLFSCGSDENQDLNESDVQKNEPHIAKVIDKIPVKGYTYLQVKENKNDYWIAVPTMEIEKGETVYFSKFMVMEDFRSDNIDRSFDSILFVEDARKSTTPDEMKKIHSGAGSTEKQKVNIEPLDDGTTIQQIYSSKSDLKGKVVKVKGQVVKFNKQIMNRNWIHIQDGTGKENEYDLVVTSQTEARVGDIIIAEGNLSVDKDFGAGYFFPVIIENANIQIQ